VGHDSDVAATELNQLSKQVAKQHYPATALEAQFDSLDVLFEGNRGNASGILFPAVINGLDAEFDERGHERLRKAIAHAPAAGEHDQRTPRAPLHGRSSSHF
jgi:hypothetical protein